MSARPEPPFQPESPGSEAETESGSESGQRPADEAAPAEPAQSDQTVQTDLAAQPGQPVGPAQPFGPVAVRRSWWAEFRPESGEVRDLVVLVVALAVAGLAGGVAWWLLAPAERYEVVDGGVRGLQAESEALVGADLTFVAVISVIGLIAAGVLWIRPRWRGPLTAVALAVGLIACGVVAWQLGQTLRPAPTPDELSTVGQIVEGPLRLRAWVALLAPPVLALLVHVVCAVLASRDDLGHGRPRPAAAVSSSTDPRPVR